MSFESRGQTAVCLCAGRAVVLDEPSNRYLLLTGQAEAAIKDALALTRLENTHWNLPPDIVLTGKLSDRRLVTCSVNVPTTSLPETADRVKHPYHALPQVGYHLVKTLIAQRQNSFAGLLERLRRRRAKMAPSPALSPENGKDVLYYAARFNAARHLLPIRTICLQDSLALLDFLWQCGFCPHLVIGVRLNPFSAHCWVQTAGMLLNETADNAAAFHPIQVI